MFELVLRLLQHFDNNTYSSTGDRTGTLYNVLPHTEAKNIKLLIFVMVLQTLAFDMGT